MVRKMTGMLSIRIQKETIEKLKNKYEKKKKIVEKNDPEINYSFQDYLRELLEKGIEK